MVAFSQSLCRRVSRLALPGLLAAGCGEGLPLEERIASTRPLAMRVEKVDPTAPAGAPVAAEGLPLDTMRVIPLIVDEQAPLTLDEIAGQIEPVWISCALQPIEGLFSCLSGRLPLELADIPDCPPVDLASIDVTSGSLEIPPSPCRVTGGTPAQPELTIALDPAFLLGGDIELTMIGHVPGEGSTDECADALLGKAGELPSSCIYATQRVAVGPDGELLTLAAQFGIEIQGVPPPPEPIPAPDTHPRIQSFTVNVLDEEDNLIETLLPGRGDTITVPAGAQLELETIAPEADLQTYVIPVDMSSYEDRDEAYDGRWFRTWGDLLSSVSNDPRSVNTWMMVPGEQDEEELPPDNRATLYYVLRDGRQGVDWWWLHVELTQE